jgi:hypothetical protein
MKKKLDSIQLDLNLLFIHIKGKWKPDEQEKKAAWELYIELVTRISVVELKKSEGILREALSSLYSLFPTTRQVLRHYGSSIAATHEDADYSLARLAVNFLNYELRPILSKWHPLLQDYEEQREKGVSIKAHEDRWEMNQELRKVLDDSRTVLIEYSKFLASAAGIEPLIEESKDGE